jgi:hypothetical protein
MAFFNAPGRLKPYSGLAISTASLADSARFFDCACWLPQMPKIFITVMPPESPSYSRELC